MNRKIHSDWKGIVLAGGTGSRLHPITLSSSKQLLPIYDKPMVYYPISTLMLAGIREIMIISTPRDLPRFRDLLGTGESIGVSFDYAVQEEPRGIAQAFLLADKFIANSNVCLILGDNLFYGKMQFLRRPLENRKGATIFGYPVQDPQRYGVVEFDGAGKVLGIEEKPQHPKSRYAVPGLYCYDNSVLEIARGLGPSARGELEITDVNRAYLDSGNLRVELLGRGMAWLDTGTPDSLLAAASFVAGIEKRQGLKIGCLEEVAYRMNYIDLAQLEKLIRALGDNEYAHYLRRVSTEAKDGRQVC
ncbi:MAG: glucose-1-phosphate thymidylyltransferase RfbA [Kiritimatiellia bacterium]